jgi:hypothetical protein
MQLLERVSIRTLIVLGAGALVFVGSRRSDPPSRVAIALTPPPESIDVAVALDNPPPPVVDLTFTAGGETWLALSELPTQGVTSRGLVRMVEDGGTFATIAAVVPDPAWNGREVVVDGGCREALHEFALIHRVTGDPSYATDQPVERWTSPLVRERGEPVIAAKLSHCKGAFASTSPVERMATYDAPVLIERAWAALRQTEFAKNAEEQWKDAGATTTWIHDVVVDTMIARDHRGTTWVSSHVHTQGIGCGAPSANFWGLFRVRADQSLELVTVRELDVGSLDALLDVGGDAPVLLGTAMLPAEPIVLGSDGQQDTSVAEPFFGCPC